MSSEIAIKVENLSKCYQIYDQPHDRLKQSIYPRLQRLSGKQPQQYFGEFWALKDVSFEIKKGETVGIIGRNGSGKSTLLQMICGTLNPTSGNIRASGRVAALLELGSGFNPDFTGRENVYLNATVLGLTKSEIDARFDAIAAFADIGAFIDKAVKTYSSGMMVRLAFAVAINVDPEILIVDEALSVGDELFQRKCFSRIEAIRAAGATILFVSHSGGTIVELCDRAILLDSGKKLAIGSPKQIVGRYQKLLYAPSDKRDAVLAEIHHANLTHQPAASTDESPTSEADVVPAQVEIQESFDPSLKPTSTIDYESSGAHIEGACVSTLAGHTVNNLVSGRTYRYNYRVRFTQSATNVRFGMMIKTISGVELGGSTSAIIGMDEPHLAAGSVVDIGFVFRCSLLPGVYFLNAGCAGLVNYEDRYLHRVVDVAMFRVLPEEGDIRTGMVDFECAPTVSLSRSPAS